MKEIASHVYVEDGYRGVTVGCVVAESGVICIDSPTSPRDARDWREQIARLSNKPVRFVALTDAHRDRILGAQYLGGAVIAHEAAWEKIKNYGDASHQQTVEPASPCDASQIAADVRIVLPQITFTEKLILSKGDWSFVIQHVGGATPASIWVHLPQHNVLFAGDLVTLHTHPTVSEADLAVWLDLLAQMGNENFPAKIIVPGRGSPCRKAALKPMVAYLQAMRTRVQSFIRSKRSRADLAQLVPEFLARYPVHEDDRECTQRRIKAGLDHVYDTLRGKK